MKSSSFVQIIRIGSRCHIFKARLLAASWVDASGRHSWLSGKWMVAWEQAGLISTDLIKHILSGDFLAFFSGDQWKSGFSVGLPAVGRPGHAADPQQEPCEQGPAPRSHVLLPSPGSKQNFLQKSSASKKSQRVPRVAQLLTKWGPLPCLIWRPRLPRRLLQGLAPTLRALCAAEQP